MRIISGEFGGRRLKSLDGQTTRPTTDKVKESIFNIIGPYFDGGICFDLFSGSGSLGIEAISRGMDKAYLFEIDRKAQMIIADNIAITKQPEKFKLIKQDSKRAIKQISEKADLILFDPPYQKETIVSDLEQIIDLNLYHQNTIVVAETSVNTILPNQIGPFVKWKHVKYGTIAVNFYEVNEFD